MVISASVHARVGLLGNPSDGYGGRTLAMTVPQFAATVELEPSDRLEIMVQPADQPDWASVAGLVEAVDQNGYGTGTQLLMATVRTFVDVLASVDRYDFSASAFRLSYQTSIPRQVGLAGSSALVIATLRCLCEHAGLEIPEELVPTIALKVETEQLGITAGLQDRVVQAYGGLVSMNFAEMDADARFGVSYGHYRRIDPANLPPLFLAFSEDIAEPSTSYHSVLRQRYEAGGEIGNRVRKGLAELASLVPEGEAALRWNDGERFASLLAENMELRKALAPIAEDQLALVEVANSCDAPATFTGSGGAIVGAVVDDQHFSTVAGALNSIGAKVVRLGPPPSP